VDALALPAAFTALGAAHGPLIVIQQQGGSGSGTNSAGSNAGENGWAFAGYRGPSNTGYSAVYDAGLGRNLQQSDLALYTGPNAFSGTYFRQHIILSNVSLVGDTTFNQCLIEAPAGSASKTGHYLFGGPYALTLTDTEVNGNGKSGGDVSPYPSGYGYEAMNNLAGGSQLASIHILRSNLYGSVDIIRQSHGYIGYSWIHGNVHYYTAAGVSTHSDHVQFDGGGSNWTCEYSTLGTPKSVAAAAGTDWAQYEPIWNCGFIQLSTASTGQTLSNLTMRSCYANDGNYAIQGGPNGTGTWYASFSNVLFTGNRCGPNHRYGALNGGMRTAASDGSTMTFDGTNVYDDTFTAYWGKTYSKDQVFG
jgi:hypothetical protein